MRIGIFTDTYPPFINGVSTSIQMLENALIKKGHKVFIVTVNPEDMTYKLDKNERVLRIPGIPIGIYDYRLTTLYPIKAVNIIKEWNLDIIHTHTEFGIGTFARVIGKQFDIPVVHTYHTMYEDYVHYITKGYFDGPSKKIVEYLTKFYCDKTIEELIVPTKKTYDLFKEKYKYDRNVHIIPTGIEIERFYKEKIELNKINNKKTELGITSDDVVVLFVGRVASEKNVEFLINNHSQLIKKNKNAKLLIVGDGPDLEKYKKLAKKQKIEENIIFTGKVPWNDIPIYYNIADIFVTASNTETQGLTVIEAMAASVPVVALDDESFRNTVIDGLTGYLFKNKKEYINRMIELIGDKEKRLSMGNQGRINSETYSSKYFAERVLHVYKTALKGRTLKKDKTFFSRVKNIVKRGFHGK
ncbi:MAG: glycosyltransferase family 4 protein [Firmicutes bacterium]|nr:glycosyltransferase family 4 protein [Bacillota bacterium]